jgi:hypothetical protein
MALVSKDFTELIKRIPGSDVNRSCRFNKAYYAFWEGYVYFLRLTKEAAEWTELDLSTELPEDLESHQEVSYRNKIILFAGIEPSQSVSKVWIIHTDSGEV